MGQIENIKKLFSDFCFYRNDGGEKEFNEWLDENFSEQPVENKEHVVYVLTPARELPINDGCYMTKWTGVPAFTEKNFENGEWQTRFFHTGLMTHWLKPVPISSWA